MGRMDDWMDGWMNEGDSMNEWANNVANGGGRERAEIWKLRVVDMNLVRMEQFWMLEQCALCFCSIGHLHLISCWLLLVAN